MMTHQCSICLKKFDFVSKLRRHQLTHSGQRPFTCYVCLKSFRQSAHLKTHLKSHSKLREVSLILSQEIDSQISSSSTEESSDKHVGVQISGEENIWYNSFQMCNQSESEQEHINHLITDDKQTCDVAQRNREGSEVVIHEESFENHQYSEGTKILPHLSNGSECAVEKPEHVGAVHTTEGSQNPDSSTAEKMVKMSNSHQCTMCLKYFSAPSKLERHILIHSGLRPFCCEFCPKAFRQRAHLKMHISTHFTQKQQNAEAVHPGYTPCENPNHPSERGNTSRCSKPSQRLRTEEAGGVEKKPKGSEDVDMKSFSADMKSLCVAESWRRVKIKHRCSVCGKCFSAPSKLRRHCLIHTGQRPFQCSLCCRAFRQLSHLKTHHGVHVAPKKTLSSSPQTRRSIQPHLGLNRTSRMRLNRFVHVSMSRKFRSAKQKPKTSAALSRLSPSPRIPGDENISETGSVRSSPNHELHQRHAYSCSICSKHFNAPSKLRRHVLIHTGQRPFRCLVCFRGFRQKSHLKVHKCSGQSRGIVQSDICEVNSRDADAARSNIRIRNGDEIFISSYGLGVGYACSPSTRLPSKCITDDVTSLSYKNISRPQDEVNQSKGFGYQCSMCFKIFDFPSKLARHLLIHIGVKPFRCSICNRSFRQLCHLQSHSKVHVHQSNVFCKGMLRNGTETSNTEMPEMFSSTGQLPLEPEPGSYCDQNMDPVNSVHSICTEEFRPNIQNINSPAKFHEAEDSSIELKKNINQCKFCLKTFDFPSKLSRHLLVHTGVRPYECRICFKTFKQLSHLQCHRWIHNKNNLNELKASEVNQSPTFSDGTSITVQPHPHRQSSEQRAMAEEGHDGATISVYHQKCIPGGETSPCGSDQGENDVKSENDLLEKSDCSTIKHDSDPSGTDITSSTILYKCLDHQVEQLESMDFKDCVNRTGDVSLSGRTAVWSHLDLQERDETGDPSSVVQKLESTRLHSQPFYNPEDSFTRSLMISDSYRPELHRYRDSKKDEGCNHHLMEPPNDLPICPSCSRCFESIRELNVHDCPVRRPKQRASRSYQCAICFKSFEAPSKLKRHYVIHTGQRPFRCSMCDKDFTQSSHLKTHMLTHREPQMGQNRGSTE